MGGISTKRRSLRAAVVATIVAFMATLLAVAPAGADGTETLGDPSIPIAEGTGAAIAGTGLFDQPGSIDIEVPADATVVQVLLYWEGHHSDDGVGDDDTITAGGVSVTGTKIGGSTYFFDRPDGSYWSATFRADITALGLVGPGANSVSIDDMDFDRRNNGAGIIAIYDDGGAKAGIDLVDGNDLAFVNFDSPLDATVPQTLTFEPAPVERVVTLSLFASSVAGPDVPEHRPNAVYVTVDGVTTTFVDPLQSGDGNEWDTATFEITVPAGVGEITVEPASADPEETGDRPASFAWSAALVVAPGYVAPVASLGDYVWEDKNGNGTQDDGEPGVEGVTVNLWTANADCSVIEQIASTTTDDTGFYEFLGLTPGQPYVVEFELPDGYEFTGQDAGDDALDSDADPDTGITTCHVLADDEHNPTIDAGLVKEDVCKDDKDKDHKHHKWSKWSKYKKSKYNDDDCKPDDDCKTKWWDKDCKPDKPKDPCKSKSSFWGKCGCNKKSSKSHKSYSKKSYKKTSYHKSSYSWGKSYKSHGWR